MVFMVATVVVRRIMRVVVGASTGHAIAVVALMLIGTVLGCVSAILAVAFLCAVVARILGGRRVDGILLISATREARIGWKKKTLSMRAIRRILGTIWLWLVIVMAVVLVMWGGREWFQNYLQEVKEERPFLDVTNRQISLFLWENPEYMRANVSSKSSYLPGFQYMESSVAMEPGAAEQLVQAPPEVLFRYHTWSRLVRDEATSRAIPEAEFVQFLDYAEEWRPKSWPTAPKGYRDLIPTSTWAVQRFIEASDAPASPRSRSRRDRASVHRSS